MSATFALILMAEAAVTCPPASRLAGGAEIVRPVGTAEPLPLKQLGPAEGIEKSRAIHQVEAKTRPDDRDDADMPVDPCEASLIHQV